VGHRRLATLMLVALGAHTEEPVIYSARSRRRDRAQSDGAVTGQIKSTSFFATSAELPTCFGSAFGQRRRAPSSSEGTAPCRLKKPFYAISLRSPSA
jgi:hypothetical protein